MNESRYDASKMPVNRRRRRKKKYYWPLYLANLLVIIFATVHMVNVLTGSDPEPTGLLPRAEALTLPEDTQAPVIEGVEELTVCLGEAVSYYSGVTVRDDQDESPKLTVDSTKVDLSTPGEYTVTYTAVDAAGNTATRDAVITVLAPAYYESPEVIYAAVDEVLNSILTEDMDTREKVEAIYHWSKSALRYGGETPRGDYVQAGYQMLTEGKGDCYGYFAVTKLMLERLGIPNIDVCKVKSGEDDSDHFWSLVSVDGKISWYHFDATPRVGQTEELCLVTDLFLDSFDTYHDGCHNRDKSLYPATPEGWA